MRLRGRFKKWLYGSVPGFSGRFPYFGSNVYFPKNSHIFERACHAGIYEFEILSLLWKFIEPRTFYFDIGANIGLLSVPVLKTIPDCTVVSFEPSPNALPYLERTACESSYRNRWTIVGQALGAKCASTQFCVNDASEGAFDGVHDTKRVKSKGVITVPMMTIDHVWQQLANPKVSVIKIDVEGGEIEVLYGAINCLRTSRPIVLLEWNATNLNANHVDPSELLKFSHANLYSIFSAPSLTPVVDSAGLYLQMKTGVENFIMAAAPDRLESVAHPAGRDDCEFINGKQPIAN